MPRPESIKTSVAFGYAVSESIGCAGIAPPAPPSGGGTGPSGVLSPESSTVGQLAMAELSMPQPSTTGPSAPIGPPSFGPADLLPHPAADNMSSAAPNDRDDIVRQLLTTEMPFR